MTTKELKSYIDRILGNNVRCLLPSYWWKRAFGVVIDKVEEAESKAASASKKADSASKSINSKQDKLESGENIRTINGNSILGSGNINIDAIGTDVISITHQSLLNLCLGYKLIKGQKYRIIDYATKVNQEGVCVATSSWTSVKFDIIVTAVSESSLSENAIAIYHTDNYTKNKILAWELKYSIYNDMATWPWAVGGSYITVQDANGNSNRYYYMGTGALLVPTYHVWTDNGMSISCFSESKTPSVGTTVASILSGELTVTEYVEAEGGKGVIYGMTDDRGNYAPFDFKNIMFYTDGNKFTKSGNAYHAFTITEKSFTDLQTDDISNIPDGTYEVTLDGVKNVTSFKCHNNKILNNPYGPIKPVLFCADAKREANQDGYVTEAFMSNITIKDCDKVIARIPSLSCVEGCCNLTITTPNWWKPKGYGPIQVYPNTSGTSDEHLVVSGIISPDNTITCVSKGDNGEIITWKSDAQSITSHSKSSYAIFVTNKDTTLEIYDENGEDSRVNIKKGVPTKVYCRWFRGYNAQEGDIKSIKMRNLNTFSATSMENMFGYNSYCSEVKELDVSYFDTSNVTNMSYMFRGCSSLKSLDLSTFDTSNLTSLAGLFYDCTSLEYINMESFDSSNVTSQEIDMGINFYAQNLKTFLLGNGFFKGQNLTLANFKWLLKWEDDSVISSLVTNSYDRLANGLGAMQIILSSATHNVLTEEHLSTMESKGYTVTVS